LLQVVEKKINLRKMELMIYLSYHVFADHLINTIKLVNPNGVMGSNKFNIFKGDPPSKSTSTLFRNTIEIERLYL